MSGLHEVDCSGCGRRHVTNGEQARKLRVLRCDCGHFVRLDRTLAERRSEPTPAPPIEIGVALRSSDEEEQDDATQMLSSLAAVAATSGGGRGRARPPQASLVDDERVSRPVSRDSSLRPPAPARQRLPSIAPADKPLWYVDLGGTELVEMTIEQLILARRSGKLGEGALVWREGMPSWRPVGTLIPAASASSHPSPSASSHPSALATPVSAPTPSRPSAPAARTPVPSRPPPPKRAPPASLAAEDATPQSLASYERPLATLEFALEKPAVQPLLTPIRSSLASIDSSAQSQSRPPAPSPRVSLLSSPFSTPFPRPAQLPRLGALATPMPSSPRPSPPPPPVELATPVALAVAIPSPIPPARSSDRPNEAALGSLQGVDSISERPRWVSMGIALIVCVTASAAGASLVRSLKQQKKPQALPASAVSAAAVNASVEKQPSPLPRSVPSSAPLVVSLESLSVEHKPTQPRTVRAVPRPVPVAPLDSGDEAAEPAAESAPEPAAQEAPASSASPPARSSPYGSGSLIDQIKKATADEEAGQ